MDLERLSSDAVTLAGLRRDGQAVAVAVRPFLENTLPNIDNFSDPVPPPFISDRISLTMQTLWHLAGHQRFFMRDETSWMVAGGQAGLVFGSGPGRGAQAAGGLADLRCRCVVNGRDGIEPRLLTSWRFADSPARPDSPDGDPAWAGHPGMRIWIPERLWWTDAAGMWESRAITVRANEHPRAVCQRLEAAFVNVIPTSSERWRQLRMPAMSSQPILTQLQDGIDWLSEGNSRKVVLAACHDVPAPIDPIRSILFQSGAGTAYALELPDAGLFLGVTPEILVRIHHQQVTTMALAATCRRSPDPQADVNAAARLLDGTKERKEHNLVVEHLAQVLRPRCGAFTVADRPELRSVPHLHHLCTPIHAELVGSDPMEVLAALHPTPAVAGLPVQAAVRYINRREGFDRGLYAGTAGWIDKDDLSAVVLLRGALLRGNTARLYAGAGLVETSVASGELDEIRAKWAAIQSLIGAL